MAACRTSCRALLAVCLLLAPSCNGERPVTPVDPGEAFRWATEQHFEGTFDPAAVVARVDGRPITVGDIALCREHAPIQSVRDCLDELVEIELATALASPLDRADPSIADARRAALASAYLRDHIDRPLSDESLPEADVEAFVSDPANRLYFERPDIRQCSHLLVYAQHGASPEAHQLAERILRETDWPEQTTGEDLDRLRRTWSLHAAELGLSLRVEQNLMVHAENADAGAWPGLPRVAQPFADALFALERTGTLSPPVDTEFGTHIILFERHFPAQQLSPEAAEALARAELGQRRRFERLDEIRSGLLERADVIRYNTIEIFGFTDEQLLLERSSAIRESFGVQP